MKKQIFLQSGLKIKGFFKLIFTNYLLIVLFIIVIIGSIVSPYFLTKRNIENILTFAAVISIMSVGQFFVMVAGGIDVSVGSIVALTTVIVAVSMENGVPWGLASLMALATAGAVGSISGLVVTKAKITPFVVTLAMMGIARGLSYLVQFGSLISIKNTRFLEFFAGKIGMLSNPIVIFISVMLIAAFFMRFSTFGRRLYAIGGNPEAARLSGLPVENLIFSTYLLSGLLSGLGGLILAAQLTQGSSLLAKGYELDTIAAAVVGGTALGGGIGNPIGAVVGGLIIVSIGNIMNLLMISSEPQLVVKGVLILVAVFIIGHKYKFGIIRRRRK